jgi:hypothetical protein
VSDDRPQRGQERLALRLGQDGKEQGINVLRQRVCRALSPEEEAAEDTAWAQLREQTRSRREKARK